MSHGGYPYVQEACMVCHRNANVYMEWSEYETWPFADGYVKAGNELIPDKLIFASAHPFYDSWERAKLYETLGFRPTCSRTSCTTTPPAYWGLRRIISRGRGEGNFL